MSQPSIVVIGSSNTDMVIRLKRLPRAGETVLGGDFLTAPGGKGANQAVAASRAGGKVTFVACVGQDSMGDAAVIGFIGEGIDVRHVTRDSRAASGVALIFVATNGENSIAVASGANKHLRPEHIRRARSTISRAKTVLMQLETPVKTLQMAARLCASNGTRVILNPAPAIALPDGLLRQVSIITPNELEAECLSGIKIKTLKDAARAAERIRRRGVGTVIITLGARGALISRQDGLELVRGFKVRAVDTTAAGDIFNGALAVALTQGKELQDAVRFANAAAAISVSAKGAQPSAPLRKSIERFMASH